MVVIVDHEDNNDELVRRISLGPDDVFIINEREVLSEESILSLSHATAGLPVLI